MCNVGFPGGSIIKILPANAGDAGSIPGLGRTPGEEDGNLLQYSCLDSPWTEQHGGLWYMGLKRVGQELEVMPSNCSSVNQNMIMKTGFCCI